MEQEKQSIYEAKIDEMRKYVPFLENIIAQMKQESQDAKVAQMELLYEAITNLQSTKISLDELEKCQEALEDSFKLNSTSTDDKQLTTPSTPLEIEETHSKDRLFEIAANIQPKSTKAAQEAGNVDAATVDCAKAIVKCFETCINSEGKNTAEGNAVKCDLPPEDSEKHSAVIQDLATVPNNQVQQQNEPNDESCDDNEKMSAEDETDDDADEENVDLINVPPEDSEKHSAVIQDLATVPNNQVQQQNEPNDETCDDNEKMSAEDKTDDDADEENVELINVPPEDSEKHSAVIQDLATVPNNQVQQQNKPNDETCDDNEKMSAEDETDDDADEENVELINVPEDIDGDEMILPDSIDDHRIHSNESSEDEETFEKGSMLHEDSNETTENDIEATDSKESTGSGSHIENQNKHETAKCAEKAAKGNLESEVIAEETTEESALVGPETKDQTDLENSSADNDPLHVRETVDEQATEEDNQVPEIFPDHCANNDDDEVQIIETRNSPICLDSEDDDDDQNATNRMEPASPLLVPMEAPLLSQKSDGNTIELLDSSDEDLPAKQSQRKRQEFPITLSSKPTKVLQKRTLLPQTKKISDTHSSQAPGDKCVIRPQPCKVVTRENAQTVVNFTPTPQSNFLNAFNLQPTKPGENPPAFSAKLLNKDVIIPNAFYGNRQKTRTVETSESGTPRSASQPATGITTQQLDRAYRQWLENFLKCFTNPQHIASHTCFVLLQQTLKYKLFTRIKDMRTTLNTKAYNSTEKTNFQLQQELRNAFYNGDKQLSEVGRRFCSMACSGLNSHSVTLTSDVHTGWATCHTWTLQDMGNHRSVGKELATTASACTADVAASTSAGRKRHTEDDEYTPGKLVLPVMGGESSGERRKSLRAQRTRRYDKSFSYNEDEVEDDESEENYSYAVMRRKVEQKRLEAQQQRQQQVKSFENAFLEMFAKNGNRSATTSSRVLNPTNRSNPAEISPRLETRNPTSNASETHITTDNDGDILQLDDEPKEHRIYKVIPTQLFVAPSEDSKAPSAHETNTESAEVIICDDLDSNPGDVVAVNSSDVAVLPAAAPKNTDKNIHSLSRDHEWCVLCHLRVTRIVHHYVNEHRGCEVYTARLPSSNVRRLRRNQGNTAEASLYKNGQLQYEARCIFCLKPCRFMMPYWYQHFAMHTGEYAYRCGGCGLRKPTRSLLMVHTNQPCPQGGKLLRDYHYDSKATEITARICTLCNYVQLHRHSIVQHLRTQHNVQQILPKHIERLVLLRTTQPDPQSSLQQRTTRLQRNTACGVVQVNDSSDSNTSATADQPYITSDYDDLYASQAGLWDQATPADDLSFMICDMLDVQMDMD